MRRNRGMANAGILPSHQRRTSSGSTGSLTTTTARTSSSPASWSAGTPMTAHSVTRRVLEDGLLDLVGADVLAAPAERVLVAVDEVEPAVLVAAQRVAGVEPEVPPGLDGLLGHVVVAVAARPRVDRPHDELADLADRDLAVGLGVDQPDVEPLRVLQSGCARGPRHAVGRHDRRAGLGEAERVEERLDAVPLLELVDDRARRRRRVHGPELVVPVVVARRLLPGEVHHHADEVGDGDAGVAHVVDPPAGAELAADHRAATRDDHRVDGHERRVAVEQRRGREVDVVGGQPGEADDDLRRRSTAARSGIATPLDGPVVPEV